MEEMAAEIEQSVDLGCGRDVVGNTIALISWITYFAIGTT